MAGPWRSMIRLHAQGPPHRSRDWGATPESPLRLGYGSANPRRKPLRHQQAVNKPGRIGRSFHPLEQSENLGRSTRDPAMRHIARLSCRIVWTDGTNASHLRVGGTRAGDPPRRLPPPCQSRGRGHGGRCDRAPACRAAQHLEHSPRRTGTGRADHLAPGEPLGDLRSPHRRRAGVARFPVARLLRRPVGALHPAARCRHVHDGLPGPGDLPIVLALLSDNGLAPRIVEYLKTPPARQEIMGAVRQMGIPLRALLREKGTPYALRRTRPWRRKPVR